MNDYDTHVRVLAVSPRESDASALTHILGHSAWTLLTAPDLASARQLLTQHNVHVVLCDTELPDGTWQDMLNAIADSSDAPQLIVTARHADERLWAEVLNLGAWDVLVKPFHPKEVYRTIHLAWRHWTDNQRVPRRNVAQVGHQPALVLGAG
jgi:two-component system response regulator PilR (NtrC family)